RAGAYFETWRHEWHIIDPIDDVSWLREVWCSMDIGFKHWNAVYLHGRDGDGTIYTLDELTHRKQRPNTIAPDIHAWLAKYGLTVADLRVFVAGADAFAQTSVAKYTIDEQYAQEGIHLTPAETSPG